MSPTFYGMGAMRAQMKAVIAEASARTARVDAGETRREVRGIETELDRLELMLEAQWSLLREKLGLRDEDLKQRIREIDLSDGVLDGRVTRVELVACPDCNRNVSARNLSCIYCGAQLPTS